jgi:hypothetical protein
MLSPQSHPAITAMTDICTFRHYFTNYYLRFVADDRCLRLRTYTTIFFYNNQLFLSEDTCVKSMNNRLHGNESLLSKSPQSFCVQRHTREFRPERRSRPHKRYPFYFLVVSKYMATKRYIKEHIQCYEINANNTGTLVLHAKGSIL